MPYKNSEKQKESQRNHYLNNKEAYHLRTNKHKKLKRAWLNGIKTDLGCAKCEEKRTPCLEFHHTEARKGNQELRISYLVRSWSRERILEEIKKCIVLCRNCHALEHWDEEKQDFNKLQDCL